MENYLSPIFYGIRREKEFASALQQVVDSVSPAGIFVGDNLITFGKSLGFIHDEAFMSAFSRHASRPDEKQLAWRLHTLCWAARRALQFAGDFVECACYRGTTARVICDYTNFAATGKSYYLYDLFEHDATMLHQPLAEHGKDLHQHVVERFKDIPTAIVTKGRVPEVLHQVSPSAISFLHIDLNNAPAEVGALELLFDRVTPGAAVILDDYGWRAYRPQMVAANEFFGKRGYSVLELPTGQGLVLK